MHTAVTAKSESFTGIAGSVTLGDLIQMECSVMATRAVRIDRGETSGRIYFARGQVIHAEVGELAGETALFEMLRWKSGHVVVADGVHPATEAEVAYEVDVRRRYLERLAAEDSNHNFEDPAAPYCKLHGFNHWP